MAYYDAFTPTPSSPARSIRPITGSDTEIIGCKGLIITVGGTLVMRGPGNTADQTFTVTAYSKAFEKVLISYVRSTSTATVFGLFD